MTFEVDPLGKYEGVKNKQARLMSACGLLPYFVASSFAFLGDKVSLEGFKGKMEEAYGFGGLIPMTGGHVDTDGTYAYPEDPPMSPFMAFEQEGVQCYIYEYGIVAMRDDKDTIVTRMD
jgi:hypothetical protein